jgi:hypothetical protein
MKIGAITDSLGALSFDELLDRCGARHRVVGVRRRALVEARRTSQSANLSEVSDLLTEFRVLGDMSTSWNSPKRISAGRYCDRSDAQSQFSRRCAKEPGSSYQQASANNQPLCERLRDALRRMRIVRTELQAWNAFCWMSQMGQGRLWSPG